MAWGALRQVELDQLETFWRQHAGHAVAHGKTSRRDIVTLGDALSECPELSCIKDRLPGHVLVAAAARAHAVGTGADRVLVASGAIDEDDYVRALAASLGVAFDSLAGTRRNQCPLTDTQLIDAPATGIVAIAIGNSLIYVIAPRGHAARRIGQLAVHNPDLLRRVRLTTADSINRFVGRHAAGAIEHRATNLLRTTLPLMSAAPPRWRKSGEAAIAIGAAAFATFLIEPRGVTVALEAFLAMIFIAWIALRLVGIMIRRPRKKGRIAIPDRELPVYTILVALYREASSVNDLVTAIRRLDYPGIMAQTPQAV
ncbi:MAG: hypothetical protein AB7P20_05635 [Rhizobiaceae bacterium]